MKKNGKPKGVKNMEITYKEKNGQMIPDLAMPDQPQETIGKYGRMRKAFLKDHRKGLYNNLLLNGKLTEHLIEVDRKVREIVELATAKLARDEGVTEELKASNPMKWTGLMNNLKQAAEETVIHDLIYN